MAALEAMACGIPWIAPPVGALADCAEPDAGAASSGFAVAERSVDALAAAIQRMLALPPAARQTMGRAARERVKRNYALDLQHEGLLSLIEELTHSRPLDRIANTKL
jgi:glycosyltransferase involved in cell wall biosynthesis